MIVAKEKFFFGLSPLEIIGKTVTGNGGCFILFKYMITKWYHFEDGTFLFYQKYKIRALQKWYRFEGLVPFVTFYFTKRNQPQPLILLGFLALSPLSLFFFKPFILHKNMSLYI